ncbi:MAG TPA: hypothetical protein VHF50_00350 [Solirubrobacterales bacterium]|nr:hypothetical protein [Solirubrobacterales bacterium]
MGSLDQIRAAINDVDPLALSCAAGGLQLLPENGNSIWRLELLAALSSERESEGGAEAELTRTKLDELLNSGALATLASSQEDPLDDLICEELAFHGGSFLVGGGLNEAATFVARALLHGLGDKRIPNDIAVELTTCCRAALKLSDTVLRSAGLRRNTSPPKPSGKIAIPPTEEMIALQKAVALHSRAVSSLLDENERLALQPLIAGAGEHRFSEQEILEGCGPRHPFLEAGEWLILQRPFEVLNSLRHHTSLRLVEEIGSKDVAELFGLAIDEDVRRALQRMSMNPDVTSSRTEGLPWTEIRARIDSDKEIIAFILSDDFIDLDPDNPYSVWAGHERIEELAHRLEAISAASETEDGQCLLGLILMQAAGREGLLLVPNPLSEGVEFAAMTAADLDTIAVLETGDPLALWKFCQADAELQETTRVVASSVLDIYGAYRDRERSLSAFSGATGTWLMPGMGGPYRRRARAGRDRHGERHPSWTIREVERERVDDPLQSRIFHETNIHENRLSLFIEGAPLALWVAGPEREVRRSWDGVQSVAYWLGELAEGIPQLMAALARQITTLLIAVDFSPWGFWFGEDEDPGGEATFAISQRNERIVDVEYGPAVRRLLHSADNAGDRLIVGGLLDALLEVAASHRIDTSDISVEDVVDAVAPLGMKKHWLMIDLEANPLMDPVKGRRRIVREEDYTSAEIALANELRKTFGYRDEVLPAGRRSEVLNHTVDFLFKRAISVFDAVSPEGLLEELVQANEILTSTSEHARTIIPTRLATYPAAEQKLREQMLDGNQAGLCCRFLIEYAAAIPSTGNRPWSTARHDEAMGSVAVMLSWADLSDAVRRGLSNVKLLIRDDGRLRLLEADRYDQGRGAFFSQYVEGQKRSASDRWRSMFEGSDDEGTPEFGRVNQLMAAEAGVTLIELGELLVAANLVAREREEDVVVLPREIAERELAKMLDWDPKLVSKPIDYLAIGPRENFLSPPNGRDADTFPWLYARRWSYNRRPFLMRRTGAVEELLWGRRQVLACMHILFGQIDAGHYQALAETEELRKELGRQAKARGAAFEEETLGVFLGAGLLARRGVEYLGGDRLQRANGESLGNIDVLAADPSRKVLWAVECKALLGGMSSAEIAREMSEHFSSDGAPTTSKHRERVAWLTGRREAAGELLRCPCGSDWEVRGLFVTTRDVMAPHIDDLAFEAVSIEALPYLLQANKS